MSIMTVFHLSLLITFLLLLINGMHAEHAHKAQAGNEQ